MPDDVKGNVSAWLPVVGYCVLLFVQSSFAAPKLLPTVSGMDKMLHFFAYGILGLLFIRAFTRSMPGLGATRIIFYSIILTAAYGAGDEVHQHFVAVRTADMMDALFDALGGGCGVLLYYLFNRKGPADEGLERGKQTLAEMKK